MKDKALQLLDKYNAQDPHHIIYEGVEYPAELFYALKLYDWVQRLKPDASDVLLIAARGQHICRWKIPRTDYPAGKVGYYQWRTRLARFHSEVTAEILEKCGYDASFINEVSKIILKKDITKDPNVQTMEDALCLVFLQYQFDDFIKKHPEEKVIDIVQKTWKKMSEQGRAEAFKLKFSTEALILIKKAI